MLPDIPSYLVFALRYLLRLGPMPQEPFIKLLGELPTKDNDIVSVTLWRELAVRAYLQSDSSQRCKVVEIRRYKKNKPPQHEYLVAVLQCNPDVDKRYVCIERTSQSVDATTGVPILSQKQTSFVSNDSASPPSGRDVFPDDISSGFWTSWTSSVDGDTPEDPQPPPKSDRHITSTGASISASILKTGQAHDFATYWEPSCTHPRYEKQIESFILSNPIPLAHLAILAEVVHKQEALYNLFKYQCYWYADMIAAVIYKQDRGKSHNTASQICDLQRCYDPASGKYKKISVLQIRPLVVEEIERNYLGECERLASELLESDSSKDAQIRDLKEQLEQAKRRVE